MTHILTKALAMSLGKNRREVGRIRFGSVRLLRLRVSVQEV